MGWGRLLLHSPRARSKEKHFGRLCSSKRPQSFVSRQGLIVPYPVSRRERQPFPARSKIKTMAMKKTKPREGLFFLQQW